MRPLPLIICLFFLIGLHAHANERNLHHDSGLPIPRFVALKSEEINVRSGPGTRYPIEWVYRREGLPVEITEEFDRWRKIRDMDGTEGWVHKSMLEGTRTVIIRARQPVTLKAEPEESSKSIARLAPRVIGKLAECSLDWCRIKVEDKKGWLKKSVFFGAYPGEIVTKN